jgi:hypothetical protein
VNASQGTTSGNQIMQNLDRRPTNFDVANNKNSARDGPQTIDCVTQQRGILLSVPPCDLCLVASHAPAFATGNYER